MKNGVMPYRGLALLAALAAAGAVFAQSELSVFKPDPVELVQGRKTPGDPAFFVDYQGFRYVFASASTRAEFEKDPARYEIQLGGACARMGPLSGSCRIDLYAVHEGRIYIFASEGCRKGFLAAPEKLLESDDAVPAGTPEQARRGRELIERAVPVARLVLGRAVHVLDVRLRVHVHGDLIASQRTCTGQEHQDREENRAQGPSTNAHRPKIARSSAAWESEVQPAQHRILRATWPRGPLRQKNSV